VAFGAVDKAKEEMIDVVIIDTAGRLHAHTNLMEELSKIARVTEREAGAIGEVLLVIDGSTGQNGIAQARAFTDAVPVTGVVVTKLDGTAKGGVAVAIEHDLGLPIKYIGIGEGIDDLIPFDPREFVKALIR
jgi:fused signal recognition particle receptor